MRIEFTLTGKQIAATGVIALGLLLAVATTAAKGPEAGFSASSPLVRDMIEEKDHVTAGEIARWVLEKRADYQLVDIRLPWQYDDYHIPTAVNIPLGTLFEEAGLKQLQRSKKVVLYGLGAAHAAEAQLLLAMKGYRTLSLRDGLMAWWNDVLTPISLRSDTANPAGYQQAKRLREQFLGVPGTVSSSSAGAVSVPEIPPPSPVTTDGAPPSGKKLRLGRGCS